MHEMDPTSNRKPCRAKRLTRSGMPLAQPDRREASNTRTGRVLLRQRNSKSSYVKNKSAINSIIHYS